MEEIKMKMQEYVGTRDHNKMYNRDLAKQHPIKAIEGLEEKIAELEEYHVYLYNRIGELKQIMEQEKLSLQNITDAEQAAKLNILTTGETSVGSLTTKKEEALVQIRVAGENLINGLDDKLTVAQEYVNAAQTSATDAETYAAQAEGYAREAESYAETAQFELIEEITLTGDLASVERSAEPNGTPYNFKRVRVVTIAPETGYGWNTRFFNSTDGFEYLADGSLTQRWMCADCNTTNGLMNINFWFSDENPDNYRRYTQINVGHINSYCLAFPTVSEGINKIRVTQENSNNTLIAGTTIKIYGIRA